MAIQVAPSSTTRCCGGVDESRRRGTSRAAQGDARSCNRSAGCAMKVAPSWAVSRCLRYPFHEIGIVRDAADAVVPGLVCRRSTCTVPHHCAAAGNRRHCRWAGSTMRTSGIRVESKGPNDFYDQFFGGERGESETCAAPLRGANAKKGDAPDSATMAGVRVVIFISGRVCSFCAGLGMDPVERELSRKNSGKMFAALP